VSNFVNIRQRRRNSVVGITARIRAGRSGVRSAVRAKDFVFSKTTRLALGPKQAPIHGEDREYLSIHYWTREHASYVTKAQVSNQTQHGNMSLLDYTDEGQNRTFSNVNSLHGLESNAYIYPFKHDNFN
jgi:hypothetical protein